MFLSLALVVAVIAIGGGLGRMDQVLSSQGAQLSPAGSGAGYLRSSVVLSTMPGLAVRQQIEARTPAVQEPQPTPEPTPQPTPEPTPEPRPAIFLYAIQPGDTLSSIAAAFGLDPQYIIWNNPEVSDDPDSLSVGQNLVIPSTGGIIYHVKLGDTLTDIAASFGIDVESVVAFAPNNLASVDSISEKAVLVLPGAVPPPPPTPIAYPLVASASQPTPPPQEAQPAPAPSSGYIWPWSGAITTYFSAGHLGIDLDGCGRDGAPVVAAAAGQVILATWDNWGLGNQVIIQHADGSRTRYGHLSDISVALGQYVAQGEVVGGVGNTGYAYGGCGGTHLHFEIWINGVPVDPLLYLS